MSGSQVGLTGWFGVLFINVIGNWFGSFQIDTEYGNTPEEPAPNPREPVKFVPKENKPRQSAESPPRLTIIDSRDLQQSIQTLASAAMATESENQPEDTGSTEPEVKGVATTLSDTERAEDEESNVWLWIVMGAVVLTGVSAVGLRRFA